MAEMYVPPSELRVGDVLIADDGTGAEIVQIYRDEWDTWVDLSDEDDLHLADSEYRIRRPDHT